MSEPTKESIINSLQQAKQAGQLTTENIREIIKNAISETASEVKAGRSEIKSHLQETIAAVAEVYQDKKGEIKEEITASIQGAIDGISKVRREAISETKSEIKTLEVKVEEVEEELQQEIDEVLTDLETNSRAKSAQVSNAVTEAVDSIKNSEEVALLRKRYAQLKAQLAIVQANLSNRYGENYGNVNQYLDDAKSWYQKAKENPEEFTGKVETKYQEFEDKLGKTGEAIAKKERQVEQMLQELWRSISEIFREHK